MWRYDPTSAAVIHLVTVEVLRGKWTIHITDDYTEEEKRVHRYVREVLGLNGREATFRPGLRQLIRQAMLCLPYGFSLHEVTWGRANVHSFGSCWVPRKIGWRAPWSIKEWVWRGNELKACVQISEHDYGSNTPMSVRGMPDRGNISRTSDTIIPMAKCLLFRHQPLDGNPEGTSALRPGWKWHKAKDDTLRRDQISQDRLTHGIFVVRELGDEDGVYATLTSEDIFLLKEMLEALQEGRTNRIVVPLGLEVTIDWPSFDAPDHVDEYRYYDHQILIATGASILGLDASRAASEGIGEGLSSVAYHMMESIADDVAEVITGIPGMPYTGLIRDIVRVKWPNYTGRMPKLVVQGISHQDIHKLINTMSRGSQFLLYTPSAEDELDIREAARLRPDTVEAIQERRKAVAERANNAQSTQGDQARQNKPAEPDEINNGTASVDPEDQEDQEEDNGSA